MNPTATRARIVEIATGEVGDQAKGSPEVFGYWRDVLPASWTDAQVLQYAKTKEWCGGFALWCVKEADAAPGVFWQDGIGFVGPCKLPRVTCPLPGDIAIKPSPYWHHAIVESLGGGVLVTIDGNQPGVVRRERPPPDDMIYYSIAPLLVEASPPRPSRPVLREGAYSSDVEVLQRLLGGLRTDGRFGPITRARVVAFQLARGLKPDGVVGPLTWAALVS